MKTNPLLALLGSLTVTSPTLHAAGLTASDGEAVDLFGISTSLSGSIGLVGAYQDDIGANPNQGSAYVFRSLDTATGSITQNVKLTASDGATSDFFGISTGLSGSIGLVGARFDDIGANSDQGSAYVFRSLDTATGTLTENVKLTASDGAGSDQFGQSVSLSGSIGVVGAYLDDIGFTNQGSAYVFRSLDTATGTITQNVKLTASDGTADDRFGGFVSLSGSIGLVGAYLDDIGANSNQGSAYVFRSLDTATGSITQNVKLTASDGATSDFFGISTSLSGSIGLVGAYQDDIGANPNQGSAYVFRSLDTATGSITQNVKLTASDGAADDNFGIATSLSGSIGLVGANSDDIGANSNQGSAYVFRSLDTATGSITQNVKLTASDGALNDNFGISVGLDGDQFVIGASFKNSLTGKAYSGSIASVTMLDAGSTSKTISQISFVSQDDWIIGQTTDANQVTLSAGDSANVTAAGKVVSIGQNAGSDNNTLVINGTLTATQINVGATGNTGNKLVANGSATAPVAVRSGSIVSGTGTIIGSVTLASGSLISPGASIESLATGSETWAGGAGFQLEMKTDGTGAAAADWDLLAITGTLTINATAGDPFDVNLYTMLSTTTAGVLGTWDGSMDHTWAAFVTTTGGISGFDAAKFSVDAGQFQNSAPGTFAVAQNGNSLDLTYTAIPEPGSAAVLALGAGLLALRRRRE